mmetsp:Transcript_55509/g.166437  ORF Transcript_55509/g.166437 Transcript_55509/m.166437 type:complete len:322 (+) Transcript_55509:443-1408(+)
MCKWTPYRKFAVAPFFFLNPSISPCRPSSPPPPCYTLYTLGMGRGRGRPRTRPNATQRNARRPSSPSSSLLHWETCAEKFAALSLARLPPPPPPRTAAGGSMMPEVSPGPSVVAASDPTKMPAGGHAPTPPVPLPRRIRGDPSHIDPTNFRKKGVERGICRASGSTGRTDPRGSRHVSLIFPDGRGECVGGIWPMNVASPLRDDDRTEGVYVSYLLPPLARSHILASRPFGSENSSPPPPPVRIGVRRRNVGKKGGPPAPPRRSSSHLRRPSSRVRDPPFLPLRVGSGPSPVTTTTRRRRRLLPSIFLSLRQNLRARAPPL